MPVSLKLKPSELYARIKSIASGRYHYQLPEKQTELLCLQNANNKISLLRDICIKLGIKLITHESKELILDNDLNTLQGKLSFQQSKVNAQSKQSSSKKKSQQPALS